MDSIWFDEDDSFDDCISDDSTGVFYGCFNQPPNLIAERLPRPKAPIQFHNFTLKNSQNINIRKISVQVPQNSYVYAQSKLNFIPHISV